MLLKIYPHDQDWSLLHTMPVTKLRRHQQHAGASTSNELDTGRSPQGHGDFLCLIPEIEEKNKPRGVGLGIGPFVNEQNVTRVYWALKTFCLEINAKEVGVLRE